MSVDDQRSGAASFEERVREVHDREYNERIVDGFRRGYWLALLIALGLAAAGYLDHEGRSLAFTITPPLVCAAALTTIPFLYRFAFFQRRPNLVIRWIGVLCAFGLGTLASDRGGFESVVSVGMIVVWFFGSILTPLRPGTFVVNITEQTLLLSATILYFTESPGNPLWFVAVATSNAGLVVAGAWLRDRRELEAVRVRLRLDAANAELSDSHRSLESLNANLEERVDEQVAEIVARSEDIERLNARLRQQVADRSRELALALARLDADDDGDMLSEGSVFHERVRVREMLGSGGMGEVYRAEDLTTGETVALKVIRLRSGGDVAKLMRFVNEARAAASVDHPAIVKTFHVDVTKEGTLYQILELVEGRTLEARLRDGRLSREKALAIGSALAEALAAAHSEGVVHRDIKPSNLMLTDEAPGLKVLDFGISKWVDPEDAIQTAQLTGTQDVLGTPIYMSPEQVMAPKDVSIASDVYSMGVVLYRLLSGELPLVAETPHQYLFAHVQQAPRPISEHIPDLDAALATCLDRCLAKKPAERPQANEVADAIDKARAAQPDAKSAAS